MSQQASDLKIDSYKKRALPLKPKPNSIYYILPENTTEVIVYITDLSGNPIKVIDIKSLASVLSVRGTGVTGTTTNPRIDIETFVSSQIGNLIQVSTKDGKLFVKPITSPDGSIEVTTTNSELQVKIPQDILDRINNTLQVGGSISSLTNDAGYINEQTLALLQAQVDYNQENAVADKNFLFYQGIPSEIWVIDHPLEKKPSVTILDSAGTEVKGHIKYNSINQVTLTFSASFSGEATLN